MGGLQNKSDLMRTCHYCVKCGEHKYIFNNLQLFPFMLVNNGNNKFSTEL